MNKTNFYQISNFYKYLKNPEKYVGKTQQITLRSGWEIKFAKFLDENERIIQWNSEDVIIPYIDPNDNKQHRYFIDFWVLTKDENGNKIEFLIEIKPAKETIKPVKKGRKSEHTFLKECQTYVKNISKWKTTDGYCKKLKEQGRNIDFLILTEKNFEMFLR